MKYLCPILLALLVGCATPENRAKEKPGALAGMSAAQKKDALAGKISIGMPKDGVWIAFGEPAGVEKDGSIERWTYTRAEFYEIPHWRYRSLCRVDGRHYAVPEYDPLQFKRYVNDMVVTFKNGKVTGWKKL
jgi:hypothetical protein